MDIAQLILEDHTDQRRLFALLEQIDSGDTERLTALWGRTAALLSTHMEAEERLFYPELLKLGKRSGGELDTVSETDDAIKDHNEIRDAMALVPKETAGSDAWWKAVAAVNKANSEHMGEEEREGLTDFRRHAPLRLRHDIAVAFATFEAEHVAGVETHDKDPKAYVADNG